MLENISRIRQIFSLSGGNVQHDSLTADQDRINEMLDDVRLVGSTKLLGYLPLCTITNICKERPENLQQEVEGKGLKTILASEHETSVGSGALYVYDPVNLQKFLDLSENKRIVERNGWSTNADGFVRNVMKDFADDGELYTLVALSFNDHRFRSNQTQQGTPIPWSFS